LLPGLGVLSAPGLGRMNAKRSGSQMKVQRPSFCCRPQSYLNNEYKIPVIIRITGYANRKFRVQFFGEITDIP